MLRWLTRTATALTAIVLVLGCGGRRPREIAYGGEGCSHCHMTIADPRFSAELLTRTGKAITFDDAGCMAAWLAENPVELSSVWVVSLVDGKWLRAEEAIFLRSDQFHTPMSSGLVALRPGIEADSVRTAMGGELLDWEAVRQNPRGHGAPLSPS